ncbi:cytochrome P450 [Neolentinus lepideus HHB14362 ss-1]|uniref:Cytochrome P450 n=1 Tax=Neolentinus lepideus HHB14362 ss-1 TaxID=1314782 RepID=A0A165PP96_9AGAM|nr:cytochrome P450 [Neolentinus lepideus HHB14362 ss-1]
MTFLTSLLSPTVSLITFLLYYYVLRRRLPLPPGPSPKLISGNVHQLPRQKAWETFAAWAKSYNSSVIFYRIYGRKTVVLNTLRAATDLLDVRSNIYSDRPIVWMRDELVGRKMAVFNIPAQHPRFKVYRRLLNSSLNPRSVQGYLQIQDDERRILLEGLATTPDDFIAHFRRNSGAIILKVAYGWTVDSMDDYFVSLMEEAFQIVVEASRPGKYLVEAFPPLRFVPAWVPGARFKRDAQEYRHALSKVESVPHAWAKEQIESGNYIESFTSQHLLPEDKHTPDSEEEDIIRWCSAAMYAGGADTTVAALSTFVLLMVLHPEVQARAQAEIDEVVGRNQLPRPEDEGALPYVSALVQEVLRLSPVAPIGIPHRVTSDDEYLGYRIPKGSSVIANIWAIAHDERLYPNPTVFDPTRFLSKNPEERQYDPRKFVFGFGRRICPGAHFAVTTLFFNISAILHRFDIRRPLDEQGREVDPVVEYTSAITSHPKPFKCRIFPRSSD